MTDAFEDEVRLVFESATASSRKLASVSRAQTDRERKIQELCNAVWTIVQQKYSVTGKCGDAQQYTVTHQYTQEVAVVDAAKWDELKTHMSEHLSFTAAKISSVLFEHTLTEQRLLTFAHKRLFAPDPSLMPPTSAFLRLLRHLIDAFSQSPSAADGGKALDPRTLPTLRRLALALGAHCMTRPGALATAGTPTAELAALLGTVYHGVGCGWAAPLIQPRLDDLVENRWLWTLLVNQPALWQSPPPAGLPADADVRAYLGQMDWLQLARLKVADVDAYVVQPIQRVLKRLDDAGQLDTLVLLASILTAAVVAHPSLCSTALPALTRSTTRTALVSAPLLALWPWASLAPEQLWNSYCELSRLPPMNIVEVMCRTPLLRQQQQQGFVAAQLSVPAAASSCYAAHPLLASANDMAAFPTLTLLRRIATYAAYPAGLAGPAAAAATNAAPSPSTMLPSLCVGDLFAFALLHGPADSPAATTAAEMPSVPFTPGALHTAAEKPSVPFTNASAAEASSAAAAGAFQREAAVSLSAQCKLSPSLIGVVLDEAAVHLDTIAASPHIAQRMLSLLAALPFAQWTPTLEHVQRLSALLVDNLLQFTDAEGNSGGGGGSAAATATLLSPATKVGGATSQRFAIGSSVFVKRSSGADTIAYVKKYNATTKVYTVELDQIGSGYQKDASENYLREFAPPTEGHADDWARFQRLELAISPKRPEATLAAATFSRDLANFADGSAAESARKRSLETSRLRRKVGTAVFENLDWTKASASTREYALVLLLACRSHIAPSKWWELLLGPVGAALVSTPLPKETWDVLLQPVAALVTTPNEPIKGALPAAQCLLTLAEADRRGAEAVGGSAEGRAAKALLEISSQYFFWERLGALLTLGQHASFRALLVRILRTLCAGTGKGGAADGASSRSYDNIWVPPALPPLLAEYAEIGPAHVEALRALMLNSLAAQAAMSAGMGAGEAAPVGSFSTIAQRESKLDVDEAAAAAAMPTVCAVSVAAVVDGGGGPGDWWCGAWVFMWAALLAGTLRPPIASAGGAALLDTLVHAVFAAGEVAVSDSPIHSALASCQLSRAQILEQLTNKRVWLASAAAAAYLPQLPADIPPSFTGVGSTVAPLDSSAVSASIRKSTSASKSKAEGKKASLLGSTDSSTADLDQWGLSAAPLQLSDILAANAGGSAGSVGVSSDDFVPSTQYMDLGEISRATSTSISSASSASLGGAVPREQYAASALGTDDL